MLIASQWLFGANPTTDFICTFWFDSDGGLTAHRIDQIGIRGAYDDAKVDTLFANHIETAGPLEPIGFWVRPFAVDAHGTTFGFIAEQIEDSDEWQVIFRPGNTMAFYEPWDSGDYDT